MKINETVQKERNSACLELNEFKIQHDMQIKQYSTDFKKIELKLQNETDEKDYLKNVNNQLKEEIYFQQVFIILYIIEKLNFFSIFSLVKFKGNK